MKWLDLAWLGMGSAMFALAAFQRYAALDAITLYPLIAKPVNLSAEVTQQRLNLWSVYKQFDPKACDTLTVNICGKAVPCVPSLVYDPLWPRSYRRTPCAPPMA